MFEKLDMKTINFTDENIKKLAEIFPNVVGEDENGKVIDFEALKQELSGNIVEGYKERYSLNWPGKRKAQLKANTPTTKTLRPCIEDSVNFDTTENLYIEGDNLEVLKILQEGYLSKIKMIYIDPPYNTGKDFVYKDNFTRDSEEELLESGQIDEDGGKLVANPETNGRYHSDWLSMMYPRIKLARNLLKEDGVIFISIDDNEVHNLRKVCDEIFGENNFIIDLIWNKQHSQQQGLFKKYHETILCYTKNLAVHTNISGGDGIIDAGAMKKISKANPASEFKFPAGTKIFADNGTKFEGTYGDSEKITVVSGEFIVKDNKLVNEVVLSAGWTQKNQMISWFAGKETFDTKGQKVLEFYFTSTGKLKCKKERTKITPSSLLEKFGMVSEQTDKLIRLMGGNYFDNPKPIEMIKLFSKWFVGKNQLILDFFSGSATTAHATIQLNSEDDGNRKFIMVQIPELTDEKSEAYKAGYKNICEIGKERIRRAGKKIVEESGKTDLDIGFRVLKLDNSNMKDIYFTPQELGQSQMDYSVDNIKEDRSDLDLLFGVLIDWGVDLTLPIKKEVIQGKDCYFVDSDSLCAYFGNDTNEEFIKELAKKEALRFVFKDSSFGNNDDLKDNVSQIFKQLNPQAEIKVI